MIRILLTFIVLSVLIGFAVQTVRQMNNLARWNLTKTVLFSTMCSLAAITIMVAIVVLF